MVYILSILGPLIIIICFVDVGGRSKKWFSVKEATEILQLRQKYDKMAYFTLAGCEN